MHMKIWASLLCVGLFSPSALALTQRQLDDKVFARAIRLNDLVAVETYLSNHSKALDRPLYLYERFKLRPFSIGMLKGYSRPSYAVLKLFKTMHVTLQYQERGLKNSSPLHLAIRYLKGDEAMAMVRFLLLEKADSNFLIKDSEGFLPLALAEKTNQSVAEIFKSYQPHPLSDLSIHYTPQGYFKGQKSLQKYRQFEKMVEQIKAGRTFSADTLKEYDLLAPVFEDGWQPFQHFLVERELWTVLNLLSEELDVSAKDQHGQGLLHLIAKKMRWLWAV